MKEIGMKRIATLVRESEAMAVRKAACIAGAESVVITPITTHACVINSWLWNGEPSSSPKDVHVRFEVRTDERHYSGIVSAIKRAVHVGNIAFPARNNCQVRYLA
jgi:hypothetical protein